MDAFFKCCLCESESFNVFPCCSADKTHFLCIKCYAFAKQRDFVPRYPDSVISAKPVNHTLSTCPKCIKPFRFGEVCPTLIHFRNQTNPNPASGIKFGTPLEMLKQQGVHCKCTMCAEEFDVPLPFYNPIESADGALDFRSTTSKYNKHLMECKAVWMCEKCRMEVPIKLREHHHKTHADLIKYVDGVMTDLRKSMMEK